MSELISGKEALAALADGEKVELRLDDNHEWKNAENCVISHFLQDGFEFRIKPKTFKINGIEVPACGENYIPNSYMYVLNSLETKEYSAVILDESDEIPAYWWRTENEVQQVVDALRQVFGGVK